MKGQRKRSSQRAGLEMTPMIDIVFQLLLFFLIAFKPADILSRLDTARPAPGPGAAATVTVDVTRNAFALQGRKVSLEEIDRQFTKLGALSKTVTIVIKCAADSPHGRLMQVLDACAKSDLRNLNVLSM